ncbi:PREDICTED: uncharacterized protein LOC105557489, partial [Vollenhovia emeryi]|uniref:uncharacterized protein LOC105557489 n=1 Tax=Vollenhovia emeryi TaxID=411798 RepID=UPI0005F3A7FE
MVPGTRAADLVTTFPQSGENYPRAAEALRERFGNEKVLKQVYIRELVKMVMANGGQQNTSLSKMFDKLSAHLQALETLGVSSEQMSTFLYPIVESTLPVQVLTAWQRSPNWGKEGSAMDPPQTDLQLLVSFLKLEVQCEDQRQLVHAGFQIQKKPEKKSNKNVAFQNEDCATASGLLAGSSVKCLFCDKPHESQLCVKAASMNLENRKKIVTERKACYVCLKMGHGSRNCKAVVKCAFCQKKHCALLCSEVEKNRTTPESTPEQTPSQTAPSMSNMQCSGDVILQTVFVNLESAGVRRRVRLVFDGGCHRSYLRSSTASGLGLKSIGSLNMCHILFGCSREVRQHQIYRVSIESLDGTVQTTLTLLDQERLCGLLPRVSKQKVIKELKEKRIHVNDIGEGSPEIEVLIGADHYASMLTGRKENLRCGLVALETVFGWTLTGKVKEYEPSCASLMVCTSMMAESNVTLLWDLELIGIREPAFHKSQAERDAEVQQHFLRTVSKAPDGRYCVSLPWIDEKKQIPDNFDAANQRLDNTLRRLKSMDKVSQYDKIFQEWIAEGIVEEVPVEDRSNPGYYLPHRPVIKPESLTTPMRPVFDASCKNGRAPSLNECLTKGPNLIELLPSVLNRFRCGNIGVSADIRKAFLMIEVSAADRDFLRFLWWEGGREDRLLVLRHKRVVFGVNCSPFLLAAVIQFHLSNVGLEDREMADKLLKAMYVDNALTAVNSAEELRRFKEDATRMLAGAKMELRQWAWTAGECSGEGTLVPTNDGDLSSVPGERRKDQITPVLGMMWDREEDELWMDWKEHKALSAITKRTILSAVSQVYDPIGFLCPVLLGPKKMLQRAWLAKKSWDEILEEELTSEFKAWYEELSYLSTIRIPRNVTGGSIYREDWQLHVFSDASQDAYAAVIYLRTQKSCDVSVQLLQARARVAPIRKVSVARLELFGCVIAVRLAASVKMSLELEGVPTFYWTDSTCALAWIRRNDQWGTLVGNR